ncbi:Myb-like DNA-binding domain-containing protein [Spironucleus salmonicida]|uniref:Myb-like DNA-binding domain-containing protein n=1 Tax=Spironucleus salmonicida TaxID=348837 RepID=V6LV67_9EUKA|nr:Myb-like DNA-binding domain-containing protein [Spironucleus salmonicida]|eukprot:EST44669.1 Myb-like DNA-binding domain-containing protein [Spironucleus salmonicida]
MDYLTIIHTCDSNAMDCLDFSYQQPVSQSKSQTSIKARKKRDKWSVYEEVCLLTILQKDETKTWRKVAEELSKQTKCPMKTASQISQHWRRVLKPIW